MSFDLTLTFDNGPTDATPPVLDLLAAHDVRTTFFVLGKQMADATLRVHAERAAAEGHWMGNHTYSHSRALGQFDDLDASVAEVADTQAVIGDLTHPDRLFRPYANGVMSSSPGLPAQRATLGKRPTNSTNPNGVVSRPVALLLKLDRGIAILDRL